ncbi:MAG: non-canonical purine NTP pyrophosphatase, partial [Spirochaetaceae bacterium]|nr:non-canonical purine NTP pyrophosphatase [Spirochaetaceae bacterium]
MTVLLATNNDHKRRELAQILTEHLISLPREIGISFSYDESGTTFLENALGKARALFDLLPTTDSPSDRVVIADDSGLCVTALGGAP